LFKDQAETRVKTGLIFSAIVKANNIDADEDMVESKIKELAAAYESPDEVIAFYSQQENRAHIEAFVVEDAVVELVISKAKVKKAKMSYEDAVKPAEAPAQA